MANRRKDGAGLLVVSNRLPVVVARGPDGQPRIEPASGGLTTALAPVLRDRGGTWIGWAGVADGAAGDDIDRALAGATREVGYSLQGVHLSTREKERFYNGFCNEILWPLFHDLPSYCNFDPSYWPPYLAVNRRFAEAVAPAARRSAFVWVHDYHLLCCGQELRRLGVTAKVGFFLHIPFPPLDMFLKLPWRAQILRAMLDYDLIGFQTLRDRRNFTHCVHALLGGTSTRGKGPVLALQTGDRAVRVGAFPIGIDFDEFADVAAAPEVRRWAEQIHADLPDRQIVLGIDRLDYTKGIPYKLRAFDHLLWNHPELRRRVSLVQVIVPSREDIPRYHEQRTEIERLIGEIEGRYTEPGWVPVHYFHRSMGRRELAAWYRAAEVALVTPLKDGMNLVAKEYCACSVDDCGVLVLSEFAGAAAQLHRGAEMVNPFDVVGTAEALHRVLTLPASARRARMRRLRRGVRQHDIYGWVDAFLEAAIARDLSDFPLIHDYVPEMTVESA